MQIIFEHCDLLNEEWLSFELLDRHLASLMHI